MRASPELQLPVISERCRDIGVSLHSAHYLLFLNRGVKLQRNKNCDFMGTTIAPCLTKKCMAEGSFHA